MNIVILNRFPLDKIQYKNWIGKNDSLFIFSNEQTEKYNNDYENLNFYKNYDSTEQINLDIINLSKKIKIDQIIALSEKDILRAGYLREYLNIEGINSEVALCFRDKLTMKERLKKNGVNVAEFQKLVSVFDIIKFTENISDHVVIKPRRDAGSKGINVLKGEKEVLDFIRNSKELSLNKPQNLMIEKYIEGDLYHIDGIYDNGNLISSFISKYLTSCLGFKENKPLISVLMDSKNKINSELINVLKKSLKILGGNNTFVYHAEIFVDKNEVLYINEIACRIGGAKIYPTIKKVIGYDILEEYFKVITNRETKSDKQKTNKYGGWILIPPKSGTVVSIPDNKTEDWILEQNYHISKGQKFNSSNSAMDRSIDAIVSGKNQIDVEKRIEYLAAYYINNLLYTN